MTDKAILEGTLLKQGGKGLKAWRKRYFRSDEKKPFLYQYEAGGKHLKGVVDLTSVVSVQSIEGRVSIRYVFVQYHCSLYRGDTQKYFPFELVKSTVPGIEAKRIQLAAATREELEYWMNGIEAMLRRQGTTVCYPFVIAALYYLWVLILCSWSRMCPKL